MKKAIVLFNLGGPDSLSAVCPFLFNLFYDKRIIDLPNPFRFLLAKFISAKRESTARKIYEQIGGKSPILENTKAQAEALERELNFCHPSSVTLGSGKKNWIPASCARLYEHCDLSLSEECHPSAPTLGSSKIDREQAHYATFSMKLPKNWIPVPSTGMTPHTMRVTYKSQCSYSHKSCAGMTSKLTKVFTCMRYWHPFADEVVKSVKQFDPDEVVLLPLYPQYSTTTTLSSIENWQKNAKKHGLKCNTKIIHHYYDNQDFIEAHARLIAKYYKLASRIDKPRVLFSAHSLPLSVIKKGDPYALQVEETVKLIVERLNIKNLDWVICYQSKIGPVKWLEPSTESELSRAKVDCVPVVLSPISFVSEHSETLVELDMEYKAMIKDGYYFRVPTLSTDSLFIKCLVDLCVNCS